MKVFVAGASGAIGRRIVPLLAANGHEVAAMTRSAEKALGLRELGAQPIVADGLDRSAVMEAVLQAEPEVVIHQMTRLAGVKSFKKFDDQLAPTNRLRTEGTDHILAAARAVGARRIIAQSYGLWRYAGGGNRVKTEQDPFDPSPPATMRPTLQAIRHVESAVAEADGIEGLVLRYGFFYGPGTAIGEGGALVQLVRERRWPVVGGGSGVWSFVHVDDAAAVTFAAIGDRGVPGVYNVADDEPAAISLWLPELADALGAKPPRRVPGWLGRLAAGDPAVYVSTRVDGVSNAKAKREFGWRPRHASWREGFRSGLAETPIEASMVATIT